MRAGPGPILILALITAVGALLRLWNLEVAQYRGDDVTVSGLALDLVRYGALPTGVLSSIGIDNGPVAPLVLALPTLISPGHQLLSVYVALLNVAMIPGTYLLGSKLFGQRAGLLAAGLTAVNPWLVIYGRRLWLNAFIGPAALLFLWSLYSACRSNALRTWALAGATVAVSAQIHLSSIPNLAAFAAAAVLRDRFPFMRFAVGAASALLVLLPWGVLSLWPDLSRFDFRSAGPVVPELSMGSLERATIVVTGVAYQSIAGQGGLILDATAAPFDLVDAIARVLAVGGWLLLVWMTRRERTRSPATSAFCLGMVVMVTAPTLLLLRPVQAGQLPYLYPYYFINLIPPLLIGMAALAERLSAAVPHLGTAALAPILIAQLVLAGPFFRSNGEFWPLGGYGIPWRYTEELVTMAQQAARSGEAAIMVGGHEDDSEQASVTARLLKRDYDAVRLFDGRDGLVFREGDRPVIAITTNDGHVMASLLRQHFARQQIFEQILPGDGWTRRVYEIPPSQIQSWAEARLRLVPAEPRSGPVSYERVGFLGPEVLGSRRLGVLWRFDADPSEPFITDVVLRDGSREVFRDQHVAYPASWWQRGDWSQTRMLNLFEIPDEIRLVNQLSVEFSHRSIVTGRSLGPTVQVGPAAVAGPPPPGSLATEATWLNGGEARF